MTSDEASVVWERFRSTGDEECFRRLCDEYAERAARYCRANIVGHDDEDACDIANELFWYFYRKRPPARRGFEAMLLHYAGLRCRNYRPPHAGPTLQRDAIDPRDPNTSSTINSDDERKRISRALDFLPAIQREIVLQHDMEGVPLKAVAKGLGITRFTANRLRRKALESLKRLLKNS